MAGHFPVFTFHSRTENGFSPFNLKGFVVEQYCSDIVRAAHDIFVRHADRKYDEYVQNKYPSIAEQRRQLFVDNANKVTYWMLINYIEIRSNYEGSIRQFSVELEDKVEELVALAKTMESHLRELDEKTATYKQSMNAREGEESEDSETESLAGTRELVQYEESALEIERDKLRNRIPQMPKVEEAFVQFLDLERKLRKQSGFKAERLGISMDMALQVYSYAVEGGFISMIAKSEFEAIKAHPDFSMQKELEDSFTFNEKLQVFQLKRNLHYRSSLLDSQLIGTEAAGCGKSYIDLKLRKQIKAAMPHFVFNSYQQDICEFYAYVIREALGDGILVRSEINMLVEIANSLKIRKVDAMDILNETSIEVQKKFINGQLQKLFHLAIADNEVHRSERELILNVKSKMYNSIERNLSEVIKQSDNDISLILDDETLFMELCRLAKADELFKEAEKIFIAEYANQKGWGADKVKVLAERSSQKQIDNASVLWSIYGNP